ncbi:MFS transporter [Nocardia sp. SC052]|uniref:MFS transporter n=1 Tax=Nocardia sichangensis TaxID=3385975 RepID=UPI0039A10932
MSRRAGVWAGGFVPFLVGYGLSSVGDGVLFVGVTWWVVERSHSPTALGLVLMAAPLGTLLTLPWAGVLIDRGDVLKLLAGADIWRAVVLCVPLATMWIVGSVDILMLALASFLAALGSGLARPAGLSLIPRLVDRGDLVRANGAFGTVRKVALLGGPSIGGLIVAAFGLEGVLIAEILSFVVSGAIVVALRRTMPASAKRTPDQPTTLRAGLAVLMNSPSARTSVAVVAIANAALSMYTLAVPITAEHIGRASGGVWAYAGAQSAFQAGMVAVGIVTSSRVGSRVSASTGVIVLALICLAAGQSMGALARSVPTLLASGFLAGVGIMTSSILCDSRLQTDISLELQGRVQGLSQFASMALRPVGSTLAGVIAAGAGLGIVFVAAALLTVGLAAVVISSRAYRTDVPEP